MKKTLLKKKKKKKFSRAKRLKHMSESNPEYGKLFAEGVDLRSCKPKGTGLTSSLLEDKSRQAWLDILAEEEEQIEVLAERERIKEEETFLDIMNDDDEDLKEKEVAAQMEMEREYASEMEREYLKNLERLALHAIAMEISRNISYRIALHDEVSRIEKEAIEKEAIRLENES
jgi:hypothetical protein